jgi:hypothetical protein
MPRARKHLFPIIALSPAATALALSIPIRRVRAALDKGELEARDAGGKRARITLSEIYRWVSTWPPAKRKRKS